MIQQGSSYLSKNLILNNSRYIDDVTRLGDRTITSNIVDGKRYFSSIDAEIYFGGLENTFIDEIVQISWTMEQATLPIYGYNSYTFDDLVIGSRQITGSFIINFTKSNFLYDVLRKAESINRASYYTNESDETALDLSSLFDMERKAAWNKSFNIVIGYGDYKRGGSNTTMVLLYCVQLTGCQQALGVDGQPIGEVYSFIAKDIRYELYPSNNSTTEEEKDITEGAYRFIYNVNFTRFTLKNGSSFISIDGYYNYGAAMELSISIKNHNKKKLTSSNIIIPLDQLRLYELDSNITQLINNQLIIQEKENISEKCLYIDYMIQYEQDGFVSSYNLNNQKATIIKE